MISIWISCGGLWCLTRDDENRRAFLYSTREEVGSLLNGGCFFDLPTTVPCPTLYMRQYSRVWLYTKNARFLSYRCVLENTLYQGLEMFRVCVYLFLHVSGCNYGGVLRKYGETFTYKCNKCLCLKDRGVACSTNPCPPGGGEVIPPVIKLPKTPPPVNPAPPPVFPIGKPKTG